MGTGLLVLVQGLSAASMGTGLLVLVQGLSAAIVWAQGLSATIGALYWWKYILLSQTKN